MTMQQLAAGVFVLTTFALGEAAAQSRPFFTQPGGVASSSAPMSVAYCGPPPASGDWFCDLEVSVKAQAGKRRCRLEVTPQVLIVERATNTFWQRLHLRWKLKIDSTFPDSDFGFDPVHGIGIADSDLPVYEETAEPPTPLKEYVVKYRRASGRVAHHYNVQVVSLQRNGSGNDVWRPCGIIDPIIVNRE